MDVKSEKLYRRHLGMIAVTDYLEQLGLSLDGIAAYEFVDQYLEPFLEYLSHFIPLNVDQLIKPNFDVDGFVNEITKSLYTVREKRQKHPELFGIQEGGNTNGLVVKAKSLLDALYDEGIIPTYSFPKNVVAMHIFAPDSSGRLMYQVERGLDVAISEYAPGRSIVVDKQTYQVGGLYYPGSERNRGFYEKAARTYIDDPKYVKPIKYCSECQWFGLASDDNVSCPFCGNPNLNDILPMLVPWGFAPRNGKTIKEAQLKEHYSYSTMPLYSTVSDADLVEPVSGCKYIRMSTRENQRIIMLNRGCGSSHPGFCICKDCGAAVPEGTEQLQNSKVIGRPYIIRSNKPCKHSDTIQVNLGYDFITDMLVLEFSLDIEKIDVRRKENLWIDRSAQSLAEAFRLAVSQELDVEFSELVTGYRVRYSNMGCWIDIYLYDNLSSGAGYAVSLSRQMPLLMRRVEDILSNCSCDAACYNCLKHYRNQNIHGMLDRQAAIQLLEWGKSGRLAQEVDFEKQVFLVRQLESIIMNEKSNVQLSYESKGIFIGTRAGDRKQIVVYPSMWHEPNDNRTIFVSDIEMRFARPLAVKKILDGI